MDDRRTGRMRQVLAVVTKRRRSRMAVLLGGLVALVAAGSLVASGVRAQQNIFSPFEALFGVRQAPVALAAPIAPRPVIVHRRPVRRPVAQARPALHAVRPPAVRQAFCVRLCDGYFFPLAPAARGRGTQAASCAATCPGAQTAVYVGSRGSDKIADATALRDGRRYSALPTALAYTRLVNHACTCSGPAAPGTDLMAILHDMTLRRGDAVMTAGGFRIFGGPKEAVHTARDFHPLARSHDIDRRLRGTLRTLEVASLAGVSHDTFVALDAPRRAASAVPVSGFVALN